MYGLMLTFMHTYATHVCLIPAGQKRALGPLELKFQIGVSWDVVLGIQPDPLDKNTVEPSLQPLSLGITLGLWITFANTAIFTLLILTIQAHESLSIIFFNFSFQCPQELIVWVFHILAEVFLSTLFFGSDCEWGALPIFFPIQFLISVNESFWVF